MGTGGGPRLPSPSDATGKALARSRPATPKTRPPQGRPFLSGVVCVVTGSTRSSCGISSPGQGELSEGRSGGAGGGERSLRPESTGFVPGSSAAGGASRQLRGFAQRAGALDIGPLLRCARGRKGPERGWRWLRGNRRGQGGWSWVRAGSHQAVHAALSAAVGQEARLDAEDLAVESRLRG